MTIPSDRMLTHREVFGLYCHEANSGEKDLSGKNAFRFIEWLSYTELHQCDYCKKYGIWGLWIHPDKPDSDTFICADCEIPVYGWYGEEGLYLEINAPKDHEVEFLLEHAKIYGIEDPKQEYLRWGVSGGEDKQRVSDAKYFVGLGEKWHKEGWKVLVPDIKGAWDWAEWDANKTGEKIVLHRGKTVVHKVDYTQRIILVR